jgi:hypothetical protein
VSQTTHEIVETVNLLAELPNAEVRHRGLSFDLGTPVAYALQGFGVQVRPERDVEREGATFNRVFEKSVSYDFWLDAPRSEDVFVSVRLFPVLARRLTAFIDGQPFGGAKLTPDGTQIVMLPTKRLDLARGRHTLTLRFSDRSGGGQLPLAEIDWLRIGVADDLTATYAAPTLRDIHTSFEMEGRPRDSLVLRAPSSVRFPLVLNPNARLRVALGFWGTGKGTAEVRVVRDGEAPVTLVQRKVVGGTGSRWLPVEVDLTPHAQRIIGLELRALDATGGGRVVFGEPQIVQRSEVQKRVPETDLAVLVVLSSLDRRRTPPWGPIGNLASLGELARAGVAFGGYRVPTTIASSVLASLFTGLSPREHRLEDPAARLPEAAKTLSQIVKTAGGHTGFFTGVPTSFRAFGFADRWDRFETFSPVADVAATEPYDQAARWLEPLLEGKSARKRLLVVHARGQHPPWDVSREEVARLPPEEYGGALDARRGGIVLNTIRGYKQASSRKLSEEEWTRLRALEDAAMSGQAAGLGRLLDALKRQGAWQNALFILTSDVAVGDPPRVPYDPAGPLSEDRLSVPLIVKFPGNPLAGEEPDALVTSDDITQTILQALRIDAPGATGKDLFATASGQQGPLARAQIATLGTTYATRLASYLFTGEHGSVPRLCEFTVDPACVIDLLMERPIAAQALWRWTHRAESGLGHEAGTRLEREPASIDADTAAALVAWGDLR